MDLPPQVEHAVARAEALVEQGVVRAQLSPSAAGPQLEFLFDVVPAPQLTAEDIDALDTISMYWRQNPGHFIWDRWDSSLGADHPLARLITREVQERFNLATHNGVPVMTDADVIPIKVHVAGEDRAIVRLVSMIAMPGAASIKWTVELTPTDAYRLGQKLLACANEGNKLC